MSSHLTVDSDLLKPSERAARAIDALAHYHKPAERTGGSMGDDVRGNGGPTWANIFFSVSQDICSQASQIQNPTHVHLFACKHILVETL